MTGNERFPELMRLRDGTPVDSPEKWRTRRTELKELYTRFIYGPMPDAAGETVSWSLAGASVLPGKKELTVTVSRGGRSVSWPVWVTLPGTDRPEKGYPFYMEYCPVRWPWLGEKLIEAPNCALAAGRGYAGIQYDPSPVAADNDSFTGAFYTLYPCSSRPEEQTGVLMAWAWGASRVLEALENGAAEKLGLDPENGILAGVSRYGKSAAVAGAFEERFRVVVPSCSGAGGIAAFRTDNHGKTYDLTSLGGSAAWTNESINEPLSNLTGGEGYWFCPTFRAIRSVWELPVEQYMLCALCAAPERHFIAVTGITSEGWNNTEGQCLCWAGAQPAWELLGCGQQNNLLIHLDGHAVLPSDLEQILDYCDVHLYGRDPAELSGDLSRMKGNLFMEYNRERLDPAFREIL